MLPQGLPPINGPYDRIHLSPGKTLFVEPPNLHDNVLITRLDTGAKHRLLCESGVVISPDDRYAVLLNKSGVVEVHELFIGPAYEFGERTELGQQMKMRKTYGDGNVALRQHKKHVLTGAYFTDNNKWLVCSYNNAGIEIYSTDTWTLASSFECSMEAADTRITRICGDTIAISIHKSPLSSVLYKICASSGSVEYIERVRGCVYVTCLCGRIFVTLDGLSSALFYTAQGKLIFTCDLSIKIIVSTTCPILVSHPDGRYVAVRSSQPDPDSPYRMTTRFFRVRGTSEFSVAECGKFDAAAQFDTAFVTPLVYCYNLGGHTVFFDVSTQTRLCTYRFEEQGLIRHGTRHLPIFKFAPSDPFFVCFGLQIYCDRILALMLAARRRRTLSLPRELWLLIYDTFMRL